MKQDRKYYSELKTYELEWESSFKLGMELGNIQRMVYNEAILANQEILDCNNRTMTVLVTEAVADVMKKVLNCKAIKMLG